MASDVKARRLGCHGLNEHEVMVLRSMLRLFGARGQTPWELQPQPPFDAVIVPDMRSELDQEGLPSRLFIRTGLNPATVNGERRTSEDFIVRPIRALPLFEKLNEIDRLISMKEPQHAPAQREWADVLMDYWDNGGGFLVKTAATKVIIFPQARRFLPERPDLSVAEIVRSPVLSIKPIEQERAEQILKERRTRGLGWLGWYAGHYYPLEVLLVPTSADVPIQLRRWPDFGTLDHLPEYFNLAGLLNRYSMTVAQLIEASALPPETVYRFLNATYLSGLLVEAREKGWLSWLKRGYNPQAQEKLGVIAAIRRKLGL
ncbi:hypothetical protein [Parvibium lacunae]|uniref:Uncharacterized protein n=1 Tax=Parvibium lacunae TaxID=1888893 RepID=A0A368L0Z6_9BURK|nr:hypothetical protein [Parvibium lacunae]RCS57105.1 hypothetical protein DU000_09890 [Parvibium lacunae]